MKYNYLKDWNEPDINDMVEVIDGDGKSVIGDIVAKHNGITQLNTPPYSYKHDSNKRIKIRTATGAFWSTLSEVQRIVIRAKDSFEIECKMDDLDSI